MIILSLSLSLPQDTNTAIPAQETQDVLDFQEFDEMDAMQFRREEEPELERALEPTSTSSLTIDATSTELTNDEWNWILANDPDKEHHTEAYRKEMDKKKKEECKDGNCDAGSDCCIM